MNLDIRHDPDSRKFYCIVNGRECLLEYEWSGVNTMNFFHTYVPEELRGQGIANAIVEKAADYALRNGFGLSASCSFASSVLNRDDKYKKILTGD